MNNMSTLNANQQKNILKSIGFGQDAIDEANGIDIPIGANSQMYIMLLTLLKGFKSTRNFYFKYHDYHIIPISDQIPLHFTSISLQKINCGDHPLRELYMKQMNIPVCHEDKIALKLEIESISQTSKLIYHGKITNGMVHLDLLEYLGYPSSYHNEFGVGFYCFDNLDIALQNAAPGGAMYIFKWQEGSNTKMLVDQEWSEYVKDRITNQYYIQSSKKPFIVGPISLNNFDIEHQNAEPRPSIYNQIAARRDESRLYLMNNLVGLIFFKKT